MVFKGESLSRQVDLSLPPMARYRTKPAFVDNTLTSELFQRHCIRYQSKIGHRYASYENRCNYIRYIQLDERQHTRFIRLTAIS